MEKILLDTSILIEYLRLKEKRNSNLSQILKERNAFLTIPLVVVSEVFSGKSLEKKEVHKEINQLLNIFEVLDFNLEIAKKTGELRRIHELRLADAIIAATAIILDLPLATLNFKDFRKVAGLKLYQTPEHS